MDVCRVCLLEDADVFLSVFSKLEQVPIAEMLGQFTGLLIVKGDGLPRFICRECSEDVLKCYKVRRKCLESERQLRSTLEKSREKMKMVEQYLKKEMFKGKESENKNVVSEEGLVLPDDVLKEVAGSEQLMNMLCAAKPTEKQESFKTDETEESVITEDELAPVTSSEISIKKEAEFVVSLDPVTELIVHTQPENDPDPEPESDTIGAKECESVVSIEVVQEEETVTMTENDSTAAVETEEFNFGEEYLESQGEDDVQYTIDSDIGEEEEVMMVQKLVANAAHSQKQQQDQEGKVICCGCDLHFETEEQLHRHSIAEHEKMRIKSSAKPFECQICFKRFLSEQRLTLHQTYAYREKNHVCEKCTARFTCRGSLLNHMKTHAERTYKCDVCLKCFYTSSTLQSHRLLHSKEFKFKCPEANCGKSFLRKSDLHIHLVSHSDERPFVCDLCQSRFKSKAHLVHHGKVHTREKPYKCSKCDQAFGTYSARNVHQLAHDGIHKYKCDFCDKIYQRNTKLQVHIRRNHTGERPFACDLCTDARFYQNWELTNHKKKVHWMEPEGEAGVEDDGEECFSPELKAKRAKTVQK